MQSSEQKSAKSIDNPTHGVDSQRLLQPQSQTQDLRFMQRAYGNRAISSLMDGGGAPSSTVQRKGMDTSGGGLLGGNVAGAIQGAKGGGQPLDDGVRRQMEQGFGANFGNVRVHTGANAHGLNRSLQANAFTTGNDIFFRGGKYNPNSKSGQELVAHELTHVIQQTGRQTGANAIQRDMTDADVDEFKEGEGGTANAVHQVKYNRDIGTSGTNKGFFKPEFNPGQSHGQDMFDNYLPQAAAYQGIKEDDARMGTRAVASSRLDKKMGMNILAEEQFAEHRGEKGSVSTAAFGGQGVPLFQHRFGGDPLSAQDAAGLPETDKKQRDGQWFKRTGTDYNDIDYKNPATQKGMFDLQALDFITGQRDRHGGNIYANPQTGGIKGIDNDIAFGGQIRGTKDNPQKLDDELRTPQDKYTGLPSMMDKATAKKIMAIKAKNMGSILNDPTKGPDQQLNQEEIAAAQHRHRMMKAHVRQLQEQKMLVGQKGGKYAGGWGDDTYADAMAEQDEVNFRGTSLERSYLKRSVNEHAANQPAPPQPDPVDAGWQPQRAGGNRGANLRAAGQRIPQRPARALPVQHPAPLPVPVHQPVHAPIQNRNPRPKGVYGMAPHPNWGRALPMPPGQQPALDDDNE